MPDTESMTGGQGLHGNSSTATSVVSYSELLFSGGGGVDVDVDDDNQQLDAAHGCFSFTSPLEDPPKMLCFGDSVVDIYGLQGGYHKNDINKFEQITEPTTCTNDSSSSVPSTINSSNSMPKKKRKLGAGKASFGEAELAAAGHEVNKKSGDGNGASAAAEAEGGTKRNSNKTKSANNSLQTRHAKVKKAKLGERIVALQQLVSPFGKTDTASVLHEAKGYITFLQQQVQLLCSPYLHLQPNIHHQEGGGEKGRDEEQVESRKDLRSKGLCLIPTGICSLHLTDDNGADYWSHSNALIG